jgi:uncharacterized protein YecT (DUF1311 family)
MKRLLAAVLFLPLCALAQYAGPGVETCRSHAEKQHKADGGSPATIVFDKDAGLGIARYTKKVGAQFVSSILYGNGSIVTPTGPAVDMSFVCLLADERNAVFFYWTPRADPSSLSQCTRSAAQKARAGECIDALLRVTEQDLTVAYGSVFQLAREADAKAKNENATNAMRKANQAWIAYRDAECARRSDADARKACIVDLSRRRLLDVR